MKRFAFSLAAAAGFVTFAHLPAAAADGEDFVTGRLDEIGLNQTLRIGAMAGARHYCGVEVKQFLSMYKTRIEMTQQAPENDWRRMIRAADETIGAMRDAGVGCDASFRKYLERLSY